MPLLKVRCEQCKQWIPTGLDMDYEAYRSLTYTDRTVECPNCEYLQAWNLDDVDRSVFGKPSKP